MLAIIDQNGIQNRVPLPVAVGRAGGGRRAAQDAERAHRRRGHAVSSRLRPLPRLYLVRVKRGDGQVQPHGGVFRGAGGVDDAFGGAGDAAAVAEFRLGIQNALGLIGGQGHGGERPRA